MTRDEALTLVEFLGAAYPGSFVDEATVELFAGMLVRFEYSDAVTAAEAWIVAEEWAPKVANLVAEIQEVARERAASRVALQPPALEVVRDDELNAWGYAVMNRIRARVLHERRIGGRVLSEADVQAIVDEERGVPRSPSPGDEARPFAWEADADGTVACSECGDSGWVELGVGVRPCSTCRVVDYALWSHRGRAGHDEHACRDCRVVAHNNSHKTKKAEPTWLQQARQLAEDHAAGRLTRQPVEMF